MSKGNDFKILMFIAVLVITFSLGLGSYYLYSRYNIEKPLLTQIDSLASVEESQLEKQDEIYLLKITLGKVENLQKEYEQIDDMAREKLGANNYQIVLIKQNNTILDQVYYDIQPVIYEALANNQYVWMKDEIGKFARQEQIKYKMFVDDNRVYLQFSDGDDYQYYIVDRNSSKQETA